MPAPRSLLAALYRLDREDRVERLVDQVERRSNLADERIPVRDRRPWDEDDVVGLQKLIDAPITLQEQAPEIHRQDLGHPGRGSNDGRLVVARGVRPSADLRDEL